MTEKRVALRLKELRNRTKMSVRKVADELGRPASTYSAYEDKFKGDFLPIWLVNALIPIWGPLGVESKELYELAGVGDSTVNSSSSIAKVPRQAAPLTIEKPEIDIRSMQRDVPIYGSAVCGEDGVFELNGQTLDYARRPPRLLGVKDAYALWINGQSMAPWREHGDLVYVHPHEPVRINDYVVVQLRQKGPGDPIRAYIKRLVRRTEKQIKLLQYNPHEEIGIPASDVAVIHKIVDWSELMAV